MQNALPHSPFFTCFALSSRMRRSRTCEGLAKWGISWSISRENKVFKRVMSFFRVCCRGRLGESWGEEFGFRNSDFGMRISEFEILSHYPAIRNYYNFGVCCRGRLRGRFKRRRAKGEGQRAQGKGGRFRLVVAGVLFLPTLTLRYFILKIGSITIG